MAENSRPASANRQRPSSSGSGSRPKSSGYGQVRAAPWATSDGGGAPPLRKAGSASGKTGKNSVLARSAATFRGSWAPPDTEPPQPPVRKLTFEKWIAGKDRFEKAMTLLDSLEDRCEADDTWREVVQALVATEKSMDMVGGSGGGGGGGGMDDRVKKLYAKFKKWSMGVGDGDGHKFENLKLTPEEIGRLTENITKNLGDGGVLPTLMYVYPAEPNQPGAQVRPLHPDQKEMNKIFVNRCRAAWTDAGHKVSALSAEASVAKRDALAKRCAKLGKEMPEVSETRLLEGALFDLGIRTMADWVEKDKDKEIDAQKKREAEDRDFAAKTFRGWQKQELDQRIVMPTTGLKNPRLARFDFSKKTGGPPGGGAPVRGYNGHTVATSMVDIMRDSGVRVIHSNHRAHVKQCRDQLAEEGFVLKENYSDDEMDEYRENRRKQARREQGLKKLRADRNANAYSDWMLRKRFTEQALECLAAVDRPAELFGGKAGEWSLRAAPRGRQSEEAAEVRERWLEVGKLLKRVDRSLAKEWIEWSSGLRGVGAPECHALWDSFEPVGCDLHSATSTPTRDTLAKVLRPGLEYKVAFRRLFARRRSGEDNEGAAVHVTRTNVAWIMKDVGLLLQAEEIRQLCDVFDRKGDGKQPMESVAAFFSDPPIETRTDVAGRMRRLCLWESACHVTGLARAFRVSMCPRDEREEGGAKRPHTTAFQLPNGEWRLREELPERRSRLKILVTFGEAAGSASGGGGGGEYSDDDGSDGFEDDDDDEGFESDDGDGAERPGDNFVGDAAERKALKSMMPWHAKAKGGKKAKPPPLCGVLKTTPETIEGALEELLDLSREKRDEAELRSILKRGIPPPAPELWVEAPGGAAEERPGEFTDRLLVQWKRAPGSHVAFFSLEKSGAKGQGKKEHVFTEVHRDPPNADANGFENGFLVTGLDPDTTYTFRLRAFNGFGPGPYTWKTFTTQPKRPPPPAVVRVAPHSVSLRWKHSDSYLRRRLALRKSFDATDQDLSGGISGTLWASILAKHSPASAAFLRTCEFAEPTSAPGAPDLFALLQRTPEVTWAGFEALMEQTAGMDDLPPATKLSSAKRSSGEKESAHATETVYVLEQCENEQSDKWERVLRTRFGSAVVNGLEAGKTYRFRVHAINPDGWQSCEHAPHESHLSTVVTTMLGMPKKPRAPASAGLAVTATSAKLVFPKVNVFGQRMAKKAEVGRVISEWTHADASDDGAVSLDKVFERHDALGAGQPVLCPRSARGSVDGGAAASLQGGGRAAAGTVKGVSPEAPGDAETAYDVRLEGGGGTVRHFRSDLRRDPKYKRRKRSGARTDKPHINAVDFRNVLHEMGLTATEAEIREAWEQCKEVVVGQKIEARYYGRSDFLPATVAKSHGDGTYDVDYAHGEDEANVGREYIRDASDEAAPAELEVVYLVDFEQWWNSTDVTYVLRRDAGAKAVPAPAPARGGKDGASAALSSTGGGGAHKGRAPEAKIDVVVYRGVDRTPDEVKGLAPNTRYLFTAQLCTSRATSRPSPPLEVVTAPTAPDAPVLVGCSDKSATLKWYPGRGGAHKFALEAMVVDLLDETRTARVHAQRLRADGWREVYRGLENTVRVTVMPNAVYRWRVVALNCADSPSAHSAQTQMSTPARPKPALKPRNAADQFVVECNHDVAVGDTVLFSERLYVDASGKLLPAAGGSGSGGGGSGGASVTKGSDGETPRLNLTAQTLDSVLGATGQRVRGRYIGERTIAAVVLNDQRRPPSAAAPAGAAERRDLRLEVCWTTVSSDEAEFARLPKGSVVERDEARLSGSFVMYRIRWDEEDRRRGAHDEFLLMGPS